uniref:Oncostatin M n=1 Tax=Danio rerio TaxID=7955 RepID=A0A0R4IEN9_DANRE|nr:uncharacterized protein si:ch73-47f2.1 [Danio rerio]|eukprot:XP_009299519.1 uncharacterized protein si:ch73-47f2.1 [Danio rerio]
MWSILMVTVSCRPYEGPKCHIKPLISKTKQEMKTLLKEYLKVNGNVSWQTIPELDLKNVSFEEQSHKAQCGFNYLKIALKQIKKHQEDLVGKNDDIVKKIDIMILEIRRTISCVKHCLRNCTNVRTDEFDKYDIYEIKQWGRAVIESSVAFLGELNNLKTINQCFTTTNRKSNQITLGAKDMERFTQG